MSKDITSEDLLELLFQETGGQFSNLDEVALQNVAARINFEYVHGFNPTHHHKKRGTNYEVLGRGILQNASNHVFAEGDVLIAYVGEGKDVWFRHEPEFKDGRFDKLKE